MDRRRFLWAFGGGLGGIALSDLLAQEAQFPRHRPRARRVVQLFMSGAASQVDTFDYKPELIKRHGEKFDLGAGVRLFQSDPGPCLKSPWSWRPHGRCGKFVSSLVPHLAECVDEMAFVHSMVSNSNVHGPATFLQSTGFALPGFPGAGAWISYGLGRLTDNLPAFVVLPDARGYAPNGPANWGAGFLPATHQGTMIRAGADPPIYDLMPPAGLGITAQSESEGLALLRRLNRRHQAARPGDTQLEARIAAYEMAAKLQTTAPEALDVESESPATRKLYGLDQEITRDFGRRCLIARRLLERGVRFVQVWSGADNGFPRRNWDSHEEIERDHAVMGASMDRPAAALIQDLRARGMLDDTIVHWTTEFGRMPCSQGSRGRDHNPFAFTVWFAGGGFKGGVSFGESDEFSYRAVTDVVTVHDLYATMLHLLGIDHTKLTFRHNAIDRRLTDVHGRVLTELLA
jgi:hypothetical protein